MKDIRRSWHCRRLFFRHLRQRDKEKQACPNIVDSTIQTATDSPNVNDSNNHYRRSKGKKIWAAIAGISISALIIILIAISAVSCNNEKDNNLCAFGDCKYTKINGSNYCYDHRCPADGCTSPKSANADFCYSHTEGTGAIATKTAIVVKPRSVEDKGDVCWFHVGFKDTAKTTTIFYGILTIYNSENQKIYVGSTGIMTCGANRYSFPFLSVKKSDIIDYDHYEWQALAAEPAKLGKQ